MTESFNVIFTTVFNTLQVTFTLEIFDKSQRNLKTSLAEIYRMVLDAVQVSFKANWKLTAGF